MALGWCEIRSGLWIFLLHQPFMSSFRRSQQLAWVIWIILSMLLPLTQTPLTQTTGKTASASDGLQTKSHVFQLNPTSHKLTRNSFNSVLEKVVLLVIHKKQNKTKQKKWTEKHEWKRILPWDGQISTVKYQVQTKQQQQRKTKHKPGCICWLSF